LEYNAPIVKMLAAGIISEVLQTRKQGYRYLRPFQNYGLGQFHITLYNLYQVAYLKNRIVHDFGTISASIKA